MEEVYPEYWLILLAEKHIDKFAGDRKWTNIGTIIYRDSYVDITCECPLHFPSSNILSPSETPLEIVTLSPFFITNYSIPQDVWMGMCNRCNTVYYGM